jgi:hypothetical protein
MNLRQRLDRLEHAADIADVHTCGPIIFVNFDEEVPAEIPRCTICEREGRIRMVVFRQAPPRADENENEP